MYIALISFAICYAVPPPALYFFANSASPGRETLENPNKSEFRVLRPAVFHWNFREFLHASAGSLRSQSRSLSLVAREKHKKTTRWQKSTGREQKRAISKIGETRVARGRTARALSRMLLRARARPFPNLFPSLSVSGRVRAELFASEAFACRCTYAKINRNTGERSIEEIRIVFLVFDMRRDVTHVVTLPSGISTLASVNLTSDFRTTREIYRKRALAINCLIIILQFIVRYLKIEIYSLKTNATQQLANTSLTN